MVFGYILKKAIWLKEYSVEIYEWSGKSWEPYVADDVQVQFYMMSPYILKTMSTDKKVLLKAPQISSSRSCSHLD